MPMRMRTRSPSTSLSRTPTVLCCVCTASLLLPLRRKRRSLLRSRRLLRRRLRSKEKLFFFYLLSHVHIDCPCFLKVSYERRLQHRVCPLCSTIYNSIATTHAAFSRFSVDTSTYHTHVNQTLSNQPHSKRLNTQFKKTNYPTIFNLTPFSTPNTSLHSLHNRLNSST